MATADDDQLTDDFGEIDPDEVPALRRRRWWPAVAAGSVVALGAVLLAWQPWAGDDTATSTTMAIEGTEELVLDLPGFTLDRSISQSPDMFGEFAQKGFVFAAPGADIENGPLLAFLVQPEVGEVVDESDATLEINGRPATIEDSDDTIEIYWQTESGEGYGVAGSGVSRARVIAFAESVSLVDGVTVVDDPTVVDGLEPAGEVATMFAILNMTQPLFAAVADIPPQQVYTTPAGDEITLASIAEPEQFLELAALLMVDERVVDVDGTTVVIGELTDSFAMTGDQKLMLAVRGGRLIGITGTLDDDAMLEVLASVRVASDDEWAAVLAAEVDPFEEAMANEGG
jgi:hypothetical protein